MARVALDAAATWRFHAVTMKTLLRSAVLVLLAMTATGVLVAAIRAQFAARHLPQATYLKAVKYTDGEWKWEDSATGTVKGRVTFSARRPQQPVVIYLVRLGDDDKPGEQGLYTAPDKLKVSQKGGKFDPAFAVLVRKQSADFLNDEDKEISHNVYFLGDIQADLGIFDQGESREHTFEEAGEVSVHCSIHKRMDAKFYVVPTPAFAVVEADSDSFEIKGVPAGRYRLHTWQRQKRFKDFEATVEVTDGGTASVTVEMKR
jgi:plastocyanin